MELIMKETEKIIEVSFTLLTCKFCRTFYWRCKLVVR